MKADESENNAKATVAFFVVLIAFAAFLLLVKNMNQLFEGGMLYPVMMLFFAGMAVLVIVWYFLNKPEEKHVRVASHVVHRKAVKRKKSRR